MARLPKAIDDKFKTKFSMLTQVGMTMEDIAIIMEISERTLWNRIKDTEEINALYKKNRLLAIANVKTKIYQKAIQGDNACLIYFDKTQGGGNRVQFDININNQGKPLHQNNFQINNNNVILPEEEKLDTLLKDYINLLAEPE